MRTLTAVEIANAMLPNTTKLLHCPILMNYMNMVNHSWYFISFIVHPYCYMCNTGLVQLYVWFKHFAPTCCHHQGSIFLWNVDALLPTHKVSHIRKQWFFCIFTVMTSSLSYG